jgi:hypothetical protein
MAKNCTHRVVGSSDFTRYHEIDLSFQKKAAALRAASLFAKNHFSRDVVVTATCEEFLCSYDHKRPSRVRCRKAK